MSWHIFTNLITTGYKMLQLNVEVMNYRLHVDKFDKQTDGELHLAQREKLG